MIFYLVVILFLTHESLLPVTSSEVKDKTCERKQMAKQVLAYAKQILQLYGDLKQPGQKNPDCILKKKQKQIVTAVLSALKPLDKYFVKSNGLGLTFDQLTPNCVCTPVNVSTNATQPANSTKTTAEATHP